jgi:serine phosphatase RsbU (regulator of sigma subunit)
MALLAPALGRFVQRYSTAPLLKQSPLTLLVALAAILSFAVPQLQVTSELGIYVAVALTAAATIWAAIVTVRGGTLAPWANLVPAVDFVALGILRWATGSSASIFTALVVFPVVWFAAQESRRFVIYAMLGTALVILTPFVVGISAGDSVTELLRLFFVLVVYTSLALVVNELTRQYGVQLRLSQAREELVQTEIDRAAQVQRSLLPEPLRTVPGYSLAGTCLPSASVGGDFFDWYRTDDGIAITLGDVMGKGVGAGLIAAAVRAVLRSSRRDPDPGAALVRASEGLSTDLGESAHEAAFTTLFHARLRGDTLRWADAGHGLTIIVHADQTAEQLSTTNLPIGLGLGVDQTWETKETRLAPGDLVVSFSDGVLDLFDGGLGTLDQVAALAREDPRPSSVVDALIALARSKEHDDDVTVIALRREPVAVSQVSPPPGSTMVET